jgi:SagB-type dehydrogenase family enzyme
MKKPFLNYIIVIVPLILIVGIYLTAAEQANEKTKPAKHKEMIELPQPDKQSNVSVEEAIAQRRSVRSYLNKGLAMKELAQLLWSAQGITNISRGFRAAPSAGATYPLKVYTVVGQVDGLDKGVYQYQPESHQLKPVSYKDVKTSLSIAALGQSSIDKAPVCIVLTAIYDVTTAVYNQRGVRYVHMECGHAAENIYLQAESLNMGTVVIGAFHDDKVKSLLNLSEAETPLYIMPVGKVE